MRKSMMSLVTFLLAVLLAAAPMAATQGKRDPARAQARLAEQVRHELALLPWYGVFDHLAFQVDGDRVTLQGQVTRPTLKSDAEAVVKKIEGVAQVSNQIEVLPVSPNDDRLRIALYRAIYGSTTLQRYAVGSPRAIRIIVKNGHVTLEGIVANTMDRNVAGIQANGVPGVFSVKNKLRTERA